MEEYGDHFYTTNATEANNTVAGGYTLEDKPPMYIYPTQLCGSMPFYRLFSSGTGDHFYTIDASERDGAEGSGWDFEWVQGYVFSPAAGSAIHRSLPCRARPRARQNCPSAHRRPRILPH
ncbi:hypothetical protein B0H14DRAFT_2401843 [Mycena olivaceomarginata]|nr:hypothetical protein B0H14DRAFT_2401843 [Mycena olivaceomarginata]